MTKSLLAFTFRQPPITGTSVVFVGTSVPLRTLFDVLQGGGTLDDYLRRFPTVSRHQAVAALQLARDVLVSGGKSL
jgi:uncharacterized protein (DUF433 family)